MARKPWIQSPFLRVLTPSVLMVLVMAAGAPGQIRAQGIAAPAPAGDDPVAKDADEDFAANVFLPAPRDTLRKLADARKLLADGRLGEAVRSLGDILEVSEDFFFQPDRKEPIHRSLKAEALRLIGQMPRKGRELYELQHGARTRQMLNEALKTGDAADMAEVSRRFFHTRSGYQATFLLGLQYFDHGQPLAGALVLQRLLEAGRSVEELEPALSLTLAACWLQAKMPEKAQKSLIALRRGHPTLRVSAAGREVPLFTEDADAVRWLVDLLGSQPVSGSPEADHWLMFRGNPRVVRRTSAARRC